MKRIFLTRGYSARVDNKDYERCTKLGKWHALVTNSGKVYAIRTGGVLLHRFILGVKKRTTQVDHKDGNGLNCMRSNLRKATPSQNQMNTYKPEHNTSGYKGVYWDKNQSKWRVRIRFDGKRKFIGLFSNKRTASAAYVQAAKTYHKEFAKQ